MKCKYREQKPLLEIYTSPPGNENHLHKLDMELEKHKGKAILLVGDFNCRNALWDKHIKRNTKICKLLEDIINCHKAKTEYKSLIMESKLKQENSDSNFLNNSRDSGQFWHRYDKTVGRKSNNIVEPVFGNDAQTYIFDHEIISEKLTNYHIRKTK